MLFFVLVAMKMNVKLILSATELDTDAALNVVVASYAWRIFLLNEKRKSNVRESFLCRYAFDTQECKRGQI